MPGHVTHTYVDRVLFGKSYWKIHRKMDCAVLWLHGKHRVLYHDLSSAFIIAQGCYPNDPKAKAAAFMHIQIDKMCTNDKYFKAQLEYFAYAASRRRKNKRRQDGKRRKRKHSSVDKESLFVNQLLALYYSAKIFPL